MALAGIGLAAATRHEKAHVVVRQRLGEFLKAIGEPHDGFRHGVEQLGEFVVTHEFLNPGRNLTPTVGTTAGRHGMSHTCHECVWCGFVAKTPSSMCSSP